MQGDSIRVRLGLPQVRVLGQEEFPDGGIAVRMVFREEARRCPQCGRSTRKVHDRREQAKADVSLGGRRVVLVLVKRRFRCPFCGKVFTEPDELCGWRGRLTHRLREHLFQEARHQTVKRVALVAGVSQDTVRRAFQEGAKRELGKDGAGPVTKLALDEFSVRKGHRYETGLYDLDRGTVLKVIKGRSSDKVQECVQQLPDPDSVRAVSMDMSGSYRNAVELCLRNAEIVADKFHVIKRVNEQLDKVRIRFQGEEGRQGRLYQGRRLLLKNREELDDRERGELQLLLRAHPELRRAWLLKEDFRRWYHPQPKGQARLELNAWMREVEQKGPAEFKALLPMLITWKEMILNYFEFEITNSFAEGKNTRTKQIQRQAYGYRNLDNLNLRVLLPAA